MQVLAIRESTIPQVSLEVWHEPLQLLGLQVTDAEFLKAG